MLFRGVVESPSSVRKEGHTLCTFQDDTRHYEGIRDSVTTRCTSYTHGVDGFARGELPFAKLFGMESQDVTFPLF